MLASLPMYDWPQLRTAHRAFWTEIRKGLSSRGVYSPETLAESGMGLPFWSDPGLVLSQTCGLPFRQSLHGKVRLVGTPDYGVAGCPPGYYRSYFIARRDDYRSELADFKSTVFALNGKDSQSGYAAARTHAVNQGFWFESWLETGSHLLSAKRVAEGAADIASIDAVSWHFISRFEPFAASLRILEATEPSPGLPYITSLAYDAEVIYGAVSEALQVLDPVHREELSLKGFVQIPEAAYLAVPMP